MAVNRWQVLQNCYDFMNGGKSRR